MLNPSSCFVNPQPPIYQAPISDDGKLIVDFCKSYRVTPISSKGVITDSEYAILEQIFRELAERSYFGLLVYKNTLEELKKEVIHIHPLNTLELLKNDELLKTYFKKIISGKHFVWLQCKNSFKEELRTQNKFQNIEQYISHFSYKMNLDQATVRQMIVNEQYDAFVKYILDQNS